MTGALLILFLMVIVFLTRPSTFRSSLWNVISLGFKNQRNKKQDPNQESIAAHSEMEPNRILLSQKAAEPISNKKLEDGLQADPNTAMQNLF